MSMCAACGQPGHRYGRNEGAERFNPQACINGLLGVLERGEEVWWCESHGMRYTPAPIGECDWCGLCLPRGLLRTRSRASRSVAVL